MNIMNQTFINLNKLEEKRIFLTFKNILLTLTMREHYLLTYSMAQSLLEKLTGSAASQEIPRILSNPKINYRIHKSPHNFTYVNKISAVDIMH